MYYHDSTWLAKKDCLLHFKNMFETFVLILDKVEHYTPNCNNVVLEKWQKEKAK